MKRTPLTRSLHLFAGITLLSGIAVTTMEGSLLASLGGGDMALVDQLLPYNEQLREAPSAAANPLAQAEAAARLTLGLMLIVLGFFLHGLARVREERPVHITVKQSQKRSSKWFWMEMRL